MTAAGTLRLLVPGPLEQRTGGYLYNRRMMAALGAWGWRVGVSALEGRFPEPDPRAVAAVRSALAALPPGATALIDSLALPALASVPSEVTGGQRIVALVHHLTSDETGLAAGARRGLHAREREALSRASGVIVTSEYTALRVVAAGVDAKRIRVVVPGTDPAPPAKGPQAGEPATLLCVGSLVPRKGQDTLVRALARERHRPWNCVFAGSTERDPAYARRVRLLVDEEGLGGRIEFAGECTREELDGLYDRASLFVLPSYFEGYGMALTEALARGLPVISTTGGAIPHTVPGDAGILVPAGDAEALAEAVASLVADTSEEAAGARSGRASRRASLAAAARGHAANLPDWELQAVAFAGALGDLGSPAQPPRS